MSNNTPKTSPSDNNVEELLKQAKIKRREETVPTQNSGEQETVVEEKVELTVVEGGKKSFKERLDSITAKLKQNQKFIYGMGAGAAAATAAFVVFGKSMGETVVDEDEEVVLEPLTPLSEDEDA